MKKDTKERCIFRPGGQDLTGCLFGYLAQYRPEWKGESLQVLDIGCGEGASIRFLLEHNPQWTVCGVDPVCDDTAEDSADSAGMLPQNNRIEPVSGAVTVGRAEDLPFPDDSFDVLLLECSFSRTADPERALAEMLRVLRPDGLLLMSDLYRRPEMQKESAAAGPGTGTERRIDDGFGAVREENPSLRQGEENRYKSRLQVGDLRTSGEICAMLDHAGFHVLELQDTSRVLGEMTAQAILDGTCGELEEALGRPLAELRRLRCGYLLCAAERSRLWDIVKYAGEHSRYYAEKFRGVAEKRSERDLLRELPLLTPEEVSRRPEELWCVSPKEISRIITLKSSGSTGVSKRIAFTAEDLNRTARFFSYGIRALVEPGYRVLVFMPGNQHDSVGGLLKDGLSGLPAEVTVYGFIADTADAAKAASGMDTLIGVPSQLRLLCLRHPELRPKTVLLSADYVPEKTIRQMENIWRCRVFTHWGMSETGYGGGVQCRVREGYHLRDDDLLAEIIDPATGESVPEGETGELVITTVRRQAMPLIRYRTGDLARIVTEPCGCGCLKPRLGKVMGRVSEAVFAGDGLVLSMPKLDELLGDLEGLEDFAAEWDGEKRMLMIILPEPPGEDVIGDTVPKGWSAGGTGQSEQGAVQSLEYAVHQRLTETLRGRVRVEVRTGEVCLSTGTRKRQIRQTD